MQKNVVFLHPTTDSTMEVEIDDSMTADATINELVAANFITNGTENGGYELLIKDTRTRIRGAQTIASGGAKEGGVIRVVPETDAGAVM